MVASVKPMSVMSSSQELRTMSDVDLMCDTKSFKSKEKLERKEAWGGSFGRFFEIFPTINSRLSMSAAN